MKLHLTALLLLIALYGCGADVLAGQQRDKEPQGKDGEATKEENALKDQGFTGRITPTEGTMLRAPQNSIRLGNWVSNSSWIKLVQLAPEGKPLKKGDVVGRFEFSGEEARPRFQRQLNNARAQRDKSDLEMVQKLASLRTQLGRQQLEAKSAKLDTGRGDSIAKRDLKIFEIKHDIAQFEATATSKQLQAQMRKRASDNKFNDQEVARAAFKLELLDNYKERFKVRAPHDGVVRHGYSRRRRRKLQKGDGMPSGYHFATVARDKRVSVEFYVPENRVGQLSLGDKVSISSESMREDFITTIDQIETFPQELGFLRDDNEMPGGREKVYVVRAQLKDPPPALKAGLEVKVRP